MKIELQACFQFRRQMSVKIRHDVSGMIMAICFQPFGCTATCPSRRPMPNFASVIKAKLAISEYLNVPLAKLDKSEMLLIEKVLEKTLNKSEIFNHIDGLNLTTVGGDKDVNRCDGIL